MPPIISGHQSSEGRGRHERIERAAQQHLDQSVRYWPRCRDRPSGDGATSALRRQSIASPSASAKIVRRLIGLHRAIIWAKRGPIGLHDKERWKRAEIGLSLIRIRYIMELNVVSAEPGMPALHAGTDIVIPSNATSATPAKRLLKLV